MKKLLLFTLIIPLISFSQNTMNKKKNAIEKNKMNYAKTYEMKKKTEARIIDKWEEYSKAFEYSDFDKIKTYFTYPVTLSVFADPIIIYDEKNLMKFYSQIRNDVQDGYLYSMLEKSRIIWISKEICMLDATYSRFNDKYEKIFTGRGIYMFKRVDKNWKMFSMSSVDLNKN